VDGLLLGTAACLAGLDPAKMALLPDITGMKNEVVMVRSQHDYAIRSAAVHIVEAGLPDRVAGAAVAMAGGKYSQLTEAFACGTSTARHRGLGG